MRWFCASKARSALIVAAVVVDVVVLVMVVALVVAAVVVVVVAAVVVVVVAVNVESPSTVRCKAPCPDILCEKTNRAMKKRAFGARCSVSTTPLSTASISRAIPEQALSSGKQGQICN